MGILRILEPSYVLVRMCSGYVFDVCGVTGA